MQLLLYGLLLCQCQWAGIQGSCADKAEPAFVRKAWKPDLQNPLRLKLNIRKVANCGDLWESEWWSSYLQDCSPTSILPSRNNCWSKEGCWEHSSETKPFDHGERFTLSNTDHKSSAILYGVEKSPCNLSNLLTLNLTSVHVKYYISIALIS